MTNKAITDLSQAGSLLGTELFEISQLSTTVLISAGTLSALASDNSYNDSGSGLVAAGFQVGDRVNVAGFTGNVLNNITVGVITALTSAKMTIGGTDGDVIVDDAAGETVTIAKWTSKRVPLTSLLAALGSSAGFSAPQHRLTLQTGKAIMSADQINKTAIYLTPYVGDLLPIFDGTAWSMKAQSSDLTMNLDTTNQPNSVVQDLFCYLSSGSPAIGAGPSWSLASAITVTIASPAVVTWTGHGLHEGSPVIFTTTGALPTGITAGTIYYVAASPAANTFNLATSIANGAVNTLVNTSGSQSGTHTGTNHTTSRGTGAGTTELQMLNGILTNKNSITLTNGAGAGVSVAANKATYLGSFFTTAAGQTSVQFNPAAAVGGPNAFVALYNGYNRVFMTCIAMESTSSWNYIAGARPANASTSNRITFLDGLGQAFLEATYSIVMQITGSVIGIAGVTFDATNAFTGKLARSQNSSNFSGDTIAFNSAAGLLGLHYAQPVELSTGATTTFLGSGQYMALSLSYAF